jgi:hypothetical protein
MKAAFKEYERHIGDLAIEVRADIWELDYKLTLMADDLRQIAEDVRQIAEQVAILTARTRKKK